MHDVIVVGAGPAGCAAANCLARYGLRVLVVEKCKLPRNKSCSGQIIRKSLDLVKQYFGEDVPASVTCAPAENRGTILFDRHGKPSKFEQSALNVWRSEFDFWLANKAAASGAEIRDETIALSCKESSGTDGFVTVMLKQKGKAAYTEQAKYVIVAEGVAGNLRRKITNDKPPLVTTFQTFNNGTVDLDSHFFHAFLQPELSEYDAWLNVKDNQLVVGVAVLDASKIGFFYRHFLNFLQTNHGLKITEELRAEKWLLPHVYPECSINHGTGRIFFVGEAAGFLNPMGEGVSSGLESGNLAAEAILENFADAGLARVVYEKSTAGLQAYMKRQWALVRQFW